MRIQEIMFRNLEANGDTSNTSTWVDITLDPGLPGLKPSNFAVDGATKVDVVDNSSGAGTQYRMTLENITVSSGENVAVSLAKAIGDRYKIIPEQNFAPVWVKEIEFISADPNGENNITTTNEVILEFSEELEDFNKDSLTMEKTTITNMEPIGGVDLVREEIMRRGEINRQQIYALQQELREETDTARRAEIQQELRDLEESRRLIERNTFAEFKEKAMATSSFRYRMTIELDHDVINGEILSIELNEDASPFVIKPRSRKVMVYVREKLNTYVEIANDENKVLTIHNNDFTPIELTNLVSDDSKYAHAAEGGIVFDVDGDYEITATVQFLAGKDGRITFAIDEDKWTCMGSTSSLVTTTRTFIKPACSSGDVYNLTAKSQEDNTTITMTDPKQTYFVVRRIEKEAPKTEVALTESRAEFMDLEGKYTTAGKIRYFELKNNWAPYNTSIKVHAVWRDEDGNTQIKEFTFSKTIHENQTKKEDLADAKIPEGAEIQFGLDVHAGADVQETETFTYSPSSTKTAKYEISHGTVNIINISYEGIISD
ncbi:MAG: hypothetical protein LBM01_04095 [Christensenellaceae bacterium]|jgi:hypothetical protein|nr:hypothetical protein [Christensenellaceae bacterium]